ncbi:MAG: LTA synthase family protein [Woeseia sp.]
MTQIHGIHASSNARLATVSTARPQQQATHHLEWLSPFVFAIVVCLGVSTLSRIVLLVWLQERVLPTAGDNFILLQGLRFDLVTLGMLLGMPMALTPIVNLLSRVRTFWFALLRVYLLLVIAAFAFMELATIPFISEYDTRPNFLFVEYLKYPKEVASMLFVGYKAELLATLVLLPLLLVPAYRQLRKLTASIRRSHKLSALPLAFISLVVCVGAARSTLDHRPVNPSTVAFSSDTLVNSLALNSLYSVLYATYEMRHEDSGFVYGNIDGAIVLRDIRQAMGLPSTEFSDSAIPTLRYQPATLPLTQPKNLVFLIEESLGAEFVGSLGGLPLTPNLDRLAHEGIWFERLYATGTRSARGLEAIVAGFPPTSSQSVLKLGKSQQDFFTLGEMLRRKGYDTSFIYGGEAQFDNMRRFFANNGFATVLDKHDFVNPVFTGSWGASDEDVFNYAHEKFLRQEPGKPFFSVLFTTSNHSPWEFPENRIELYELPRDTVNNAVKYADYAIGEFFRKARAADYWDNTVFVVVSDHNSRVYGADLVPIERFHIPGLILGGGIEPQRINRLVSQIDLLPTALSLIGVSGEHPAPGLDLTRADIDELPGRAIMQYGDTQAYREEDRVVVLRKEKPAALFRYAGGELTALPDDPEIIERAKALAVWPVQAYRERTYRLPDELHSD